MTMFTPDHKIWQFAWAGDELNDWLPYAEDLIAKWSRQESDEIQFNGTFEIILASFLLMDDLLPPQARIAYAQFTLDVISAAPKRKVSARRPGRRKGSRAEKGHRLFSVKGYIESGLTKQQAYQKVADEIHKSPDTIRREFERALKQSKQNRNGKIIK